MTEKDHADADAPITVLFLCTGNSARSILGEALLNKLGAPGFVGLSAGSQPTGRVHPGAIRNLQAAGIRTEKLRSKSWDEFADGPGIDIAITVCDNAAGEACPVFPGKVVKAHWGIPDPAGAEDADNSFNHAHDVLSRRIKRLTQLPVRELDSAALTRALDVIREQEPYNG